MVYMLYGMLSHAVPSIRNFAMGIFRKLTDKLGTNRLRKTNKKTEEKTISCCYFCAGFKQLLTSIVVVVVVIGHGGGGAEC